MRSLTASALVLSLSAAMPNAAAAATGVSALRDPDEAPPSAVGLAIATVLLFIVITCVFAKLITETLRSFPSKLLLDAPGLPLDVARRAPLRLPAV